MTTENPTSTDSLNKSKDDGSVHNMKPQDIKSALRAYCNSPKYNAAKKKAGRPRINLEGVNL